MKQKHMLHKYLWEDVYVQLKKLNGHGDSEKVAFEDHKLNK